MRCGIGDPEAVLHGKLTRSVQGRGGEVGATDRLGRRGFVTSRGEESAAGESEDCSMRREERGERREEGAVAWSHRPSPPSCTHRETPQFPLIPSL